MNYEPIFKLPYSNIFITNIFLSGYREIDPIITLRNGKFEMFLSKEQLEKCSDIGLNHALADGFFKEFEEISNLLVEDMLKITKENIRDYDNSQFSDFLDRLLIIGTKFLDKYRITEFIFFRKIEKEIAEYIEGKYLFEDVLSKRVALTSWPEREKKLVEYMISMQHFKLQLRKVVNDCWMGADSILQKTIEQLITRTGREDVTSMTFKEIAGLLSDVKIKDVSDRHVYSYITWNKSSQDLEIISGTEAYKKIREFEKDIPKNEVIGTPACAGIVKGKAKVIPLSMNPAEYISKMEKGDILVSDTTGPEMMVAIEKAAAIVTDEGGMMSHAAVIAREFNIPCVVGTSYATEVFRDGDLIEVNANNGVVRKIDSLV